MQKSIKSVLVLIIFNILIQDVYCLDHSELYNLLKQKYSHLDKISFDYQNAENKNFTGNLIAKSGNKYKINLGNRIIYCDSKSVWNFSILDKNVIISNFNSLKSGSIENLFFDLINKYKSEKLSNINNSKGHSRYLLTLLPIKQDDKLFDKVELFLDQNNNINTVSIIKNYQKETWNIFNVKLNEKVDDILFKFENKNNIEVIDLR